MEYDIRSFDPDQADEIIQQQVAIGRGILSKWRNANQTDISHLKQQYSSDRFDPETRLYAYQNDIIVGFVTATVIKQDNEPTMARMEIPIVPDEHKEARDLLIEEAFKILRDKGVTKIRTRAGTGWGYTLQYVDKYGFEKAEQMSRYTEFNPLDLNHKLITNVHHVFQYDNEYHRDMLGQAFRQYYHIDNDDTINDALDQIIDGRIIVYYHGLIIKEENIVGRLMAYASPDDPDLVLLGAPLLLSDDNQSELATDLIGDAIYTLQQQGRSHIRQTLFTSALSMEPMFEQFGLEYHDDLAYFDKIIG